MTQSEYRSKEDVITTTEVVNKFDMVLYDLIALENTVRCFDRTWGIATSSSEDFSTIRDFVNMMKSQFQSVTNSQLLALLNR